MDVINDFIETVQSWFGGSSLLGAILLLAIAFLISFIVKKVFLGVLGKGGFTKLLSKVGIKETAQQDNIVKLLGSVVFFLVFLLFLPGIFSKLGVDSFTRPIEEMLSQVLTYIPNIIAAIIVVVIGYVVAKLVREIVKAVLEGIQFDKLQDKLGVKADDATKLSSVLSYVVYLLILIPAVIVAFDILNIDTIAAPAQNMLDSIFNIIPLILMAMIVIVIGLVIAKVVTTLLYALLSSVGVNSWLKNISVVDEEAFKNFDLAKVISEMVKIIIVLVTIVQGVSLLNLDVVTNFGNAIISYLPELLAATLLLIAGYILATFVEGVLKKSGHLVFATASKVIIFALLAFVVLGQLGVELFILNTTYLAILIALCVSATIAFGFGGRDFAKKVLEKIDLSVLDKKKKKK